MTRQKATNEQSATAQRILAAAEHQFAAQGMAGARTDEISSAARANKAMLYYYFGDKRRLHRAVLENLFRQLRTGVYAACSDHPKSAHARLLEFVSAISIFWRHIRIIRDWCSAKPWKRPRISNGSYKNI